MVRSAHGVETRRSRRRRVVVLVGAALAALAPTAPAQEDDRGPVVRGLVFEGNRAVTDEALAAAIMTSNSSWWRWTGWLGRKHYFDETEFRRDVLRLTLLYRQSGFIEASVDTIVRRANGTVRIRVLIHEGRPVRVTALDVSGVQAVVDSARLRRELPLRVGDPFNRLLLQASTDTIRAHLADRGYPFAEVFRNFDEDRVNRTARVALDVDPGPLVRVDTILVRGVVKVDETVVRRGLAIRAGQLYRERAVRESQVELYRTELFNSATVGLADTTGAGRDSLVALAVVVAEAPLHRLRVGGGIGSLDCVRAQSALTAGDFLGGGRTLRLNGGVSQLGVGDPLDAGFQDHVCRQLQAEDTSRLKVNYTARAGLTEPFFLSRQTRATIALFAERQSEFRAFLREGYGGDLALTRELRGGVRATLTYGLSRTRTRAEPAVFCTFLNVCTLADVERFVDWRRRSTVALAVVRERTNNTIAPTSGTRLSLELRHASRAIGSDSLSQFNRAVAEFAAYHHTGGRSVLAWRIRLGTIISPRLGLAGQQLRFVPPEERFYAGGPNSVRGFSQNELGPVLRVRQRTDTIDLGGGRDSIVDVAPRTSPIGGNDLLLANVEWRFPLPGFSDRATGAAFLDAGQVFNRETETFSLRNLRFTPGVGTRVLSPLGAVRLDLAFNPYDPPLAPLYDPQTLDVIDPADRRTVSFVERLRLHFSVGQAF